MKKHPLLFAAVSSMFIIVFLVLINFLTSWGYKWFIYPVFVVLWWPLTLLLARKETLRLYSVVMSLLTIIFLALINFMHGMTHPWFVYPTFVILWWPFSMYLARRETIKFYSIVMSLLTIAFLALVNFMNGMGHPWFVYPTFVILWWPFSMYLARRETIKLYSIVMSLLTIAFLALINLINSPNVIWFHYTVFYISWWPIVMFLGKRAKSLTFSVIASLLFFVYHAFLYYQLTPGVYMWYLELIPPVILWPLCTALKQRANKPAFIVITTIVVLMFYTFMNGFLRHPGLINYLSSTIR